MQVTPRYSLGTCTWNLFTANGPFLPGLLLERLRQIRLLNFHVTYTSKSPSSRRIRDKCKKAVGEGAVCLVWVW